MKAINDAIKLKVDETTEDVHNTFYTAIGGRFYFVDAPQSVVFPYSVYHSIDELQDWNFGSSPSKRTNVTIQIDCLSETRGATEIESIRTALISLFEYKTVILSVTSFTFIYMKFVGATGPEKIDEIWNYNARYEIEVEE